MKQPKKLTRTQKEIVHSQGYNVDEWMVRRETEFHVCLVHKDAGRRVTIDKCIRRARR